MAFSVRSSGPFWVCGGPVGCLALHGFGGSPAEIAPILAVLADRGLTVSAPVLPGHGGTRPDLAHTRFRHWVRGAEEALAELAGVCTQVHLLGFSMGGLVALHLAARRAVVSVCTLAAPVLLDDPGALSGQLARYLRTGPPPAALRSLVHLARLVRRELGQVGVPVLAMQGDRDTWIAPESAVYIVEHVAGRPAQLRMLPGRGHFVGLEHGRTEVGAQVADWIAACAIG